MFENHVTYYCRYRASSWGWNSQLKMQELNTDKMVYLFALMDGESCLDFTNSTPAAFACFLYTTEPKRTAYHYDQLTAEMEEPVLYCYELQVRNEHQGRGLGRLLMQYGMKLAMETDACRLVLTCFCSNRHALEFYQSLGYSVDYIDTEYSILSNTCS